MLQNASLLAIVAVHTAENELPKVGDAEDVFWEADPGGGPGAGGAERRAGQRDRSLREAAAVHNRL